MRFLFSGRLHAALSPDVPDGLSSGSIPAAAEAGFMRTAIAEAREGIRSGHGGPFGSVVVRDGVIVGRGHNRVLVNNDSTAHGEIQAIRDAEASLETHDLTGCTLYTTAEPCPMCLAACLWANIKTVRYGCTIEDTDRIGFRDRLFEGILGKRKLPKGFLTEFSREECLELFEEYAAMDAERY